MNIIVGIDPGTNVGIAILELSGKVMRVYSQRNMSQDEIVAFISNIGKPVLFASDKRPLPEGVANIARSFNASTFYEEILSEEKKRLTKGYAFSNEHERDALSAAINAYKHFLPTIKKAREIAKKKQDEVIASAFYGLSVLEKAKELSKIKEKEKVKKKSAETLLRRQIKELEERLRRLREYTARLEKGKISYPTSTRKMQDIMTSLKMKEGELEEKRKEFDELLSLILKVADGKYLLVKKPEKHHEMIKDFDGFAIVREKKKQIMDADEVEELFEEYKKGR